MRRHGNSTPEVCADNLLKIIRGEVPYERLKGLDRKIIDKPSSLMMPMLMSEVIWLLETYEPRLDINSLNIKALIAKQGLFDLNLDVSQEGG